MTQPKTGSKFTPGQWHITEGPPAGAPTLSDVLATGKRIAALEQNVAELLEAAKIGLSYIKSDYEKPGGSYIGGAADDVKQIEQAIAKCASGTGSK